MVPSGEMRQMLRAIDADFALTASQTGLDHLSDRAREAFLRVPREAFVPKELRRRAYDNNALPIGDGQTISQPFIVALMTDLLESHKDQAFLEIGTGSGYQAAILAELAGKVFSVELRPDLARKSRERLEALGYLNVEVCCGDGHRGWPEHAPYDRIIVTAAAVRIPRTLLKQLKPGGRMVVPVGHPLMHQELLLVRKSREGEICHRAVLGVAFVPFVSPGQER